MKIKKTNPDNTVEEIEGSPEELAEWDRKRRQQDLNEVPKPQDNRRILNEKEVRCCEAKCCRHDDCLSERCCEHGNLLKPADPIWISPYVNPTIVWYRQYTYSSEKIDPVQYPTITCGQS